MVNNKILSGFIHRSKTSKETIKRTRNKQIAHNLTEINKYRDILKTCSCQVCGETRTLELCHIVPVSMNGSNDVMNLIVLCPTHHVLMDKDKLSENEFDKIALRLDMAYKYHDTITRCSEHNKEKTISCV